MRGYDINRAVPRPRKPDALTAAERQRRHRLRHDLCTVKVPRQVAAQLDALARERSLSRAGALAAVLAERQSLMQVQAGLAGARATRAASASRRVQIKAGDAERPMPGKDQQDLFAAIEDPEPSKGG